MIFGAPSGPDPWQMHTFAAWFWIIFGTPLIVACIVFGHINLADALP